ncbi:medium chain dehydrogenase/reductase family protein [Paenibacillus chibensis]|uniref:Medium chain dehydrogenase/reductase family protein n=1 Tax=Paenibacillus chibensis TaxID=59846 RepID=A0ABU6PV32_9BACL|nr:medium chain dehydrogenase/reductase family protein [Paenibacillus chibensis]
MQNTKIVVERYGGPDVLKVVEEELSPPGHRDIRIRVEAAGVALADVMRREGTYLDSPLPPFTPGYEAVGFVEDVGELVTEYVHGDRVGAFLNGTGAYSAYINLPAEEAIRIPHDVDAAQAASVMLNYVTAYQMLHRLAEVSAGDSVLIHGAGGGVGTALLELGRMMGLRMFGTASSAKHPGVAAYGAVPIDYRKADFTEVLQQLMPGGVDAVFDPIGGDHWQRSFRTLGDRGRFVGFGHTSVLQESTREAWTNQWRELAEMKRTPTGHPAYLYSITSLKQEHPAWFREDAELLLSWLGKGLLKPRVFCRVPFREAGRAQQLMLEAGTVGKVVLTF